MARVGDGPREALREALEGSPGPAIADRLRVISVAINEESYAALGTVLQDLSAFVVDRDLLESVASEAYLCTMRGKKCAYKERAWTYRTPVGARRTAEHPAAQPRPRVV